MNKKHHSACATVFCLVAGFALAGCNESRPEGEIFAPQLHSAKQMPIPEFGEIPDVKEKKSKFFEYLNKRIKRANDHVWQEREFVLAFIEKHNNGAVSERETADFATLVERYKLTDSLAYHPDFYETLLARVDVVPASLVLAQGANESAWGTSRFAREGRNFFGIWCYSEGCGLKPKARNSGAKHQVRRFKTVQHGVDFYTHNINIGHAYGHLRELRAELRRDEEKLSGVHLAQGLIRYSERGEAYVKEIRHMIKSNNLAAYNQARTSR